MYKKPAAAGVDPRGTLVDRPDDATLERQELAQGQRRAYDCERLALVDRGAQADGEAITARSELPLREPRQGPLARLGRRTHDEGGRVLGQLLEPGEHGAVDVARDSE